MDLTAFLFIFLVGVFFYWVGSQYANKFFALMAALVFLSSGLFVVGEGVSYTAVANYSTTFSPDYHAFYNDTASCIDCGSNSTASCDGTFLGINWCEKFTDEPTCEACDQCNWTGTECQPFAGAACNASLTCTDCGCNSTVSSCASFIGEHDVNETRAGSIVQTVNYSNEAVNADLTRVIGWIFVLSGLYTLLMLAVEWRNGDL